MAKLVTSDLTNLTSESSAVTNINTNFNSVEVAVEKTLSRDGTAPNQMQADLDMNLHDILNVDTLYANDIVPGEILVTVVTELTLESINSLRLYDTPNVSTNSTGYVKSYHAGLRKGGGYFQLDSSDTTSADDGGSIIIDALGRRWKRVDLSDVTVFMFGAKDDGVYDIGVSMAGTDNKAAFQLAVDYSGISKVKIRVPAGTYRVICASSADTIWVDQDFLHFEGEPGASIILLDDMGIEYEPYTPPYNSFNLFGHCLTPGSLDTTTTDLSLKKVFIMSGIVFQGTWTIRPIRGVEDRNSCVAYLRGCNNIEFNDCWIFDMGDKAVRSESCYKVSTKNSRFERCAHGAWRAVSCMHIHVSFCIFKNLGDDSIDGPIRNSNLLQAEESMMVDNCHFEDVLSLGALGGKKLQITNCIIIRPKGRALAIGGNNKGDSLGNTSTRGHTINNIVVEDAITGSEIDLFQISNITKANPAVVTTVLPHTYSNGESKLIYNVQGMTQLNGLEWVIGNVTATTFELTGVDSTGFPDYIISGLVGGKVFEVLKLAALEDAPIGVGSWNRTGEQILIADISQGSPAVLTTLTPHGKTNGEIVYIVDVETNIDETVPPYRTYTPSMYEINNTKFTVTNKTDTTFELYTVETVPVAFDTTAFTEFNSTDPRGSISGTPPGYYDKITDEFFDVYKDNALYNASENLPHPGGGDSQYSNIAVLRTRAAVANYSDWGVGMMYNGTGWLDPAVGNENFLRSGIRLNGDSYNMQFTNILSRGLHNGSLFYFDAVQSLDARTAFGGITLSNIRALDTSNLMRRGGSGAADWNIHLNGFYHNADPQHRDATRLGGPPKNGTWSTTPSEGRHVTIDMAGVRGGSVKNGYIRNAFRAYGGTEPSDNDWENVTLVCDPLATFIGYSALNKGIGVLERAGPKFNYMIVDSDPTSPTYEALKNLCTKSATTLPTTGTYVEGHELSMDVWPYRARKRTTGSNNILGTDWVYPYTGDYLGSGVTFIDHFIGDVIDDRWNVRLGSNGGCAAAITATSNGALILTTGNDAAGTLATNGVQLEMLPVLSSNQAGLSFGFRQKINQITSVAIFMGLTDQATALEMPIYSAGAADTLTSDASNAVGIMFDTAMATDNLWGVGVRTDIDVSQNFGIAPTADAYASWRVDLVGSTATFYRNNVLIGTPLLLAVGAATLLTPVIAMFSRSAVTRFMTLDKFWFRTNGLE